MSFRPFLLTILSVAAVQAQDYRGTLGGQITDPQGAAIAGAKIAARNIATGVITEGVSNATGRYRIPFLLPGEYEATVESAGFRKAVRQDIRLSVNAELQVDFQLEVGASTESVTVSADVPLLNTANAEMGQVIDQAVINVLNVSLTGTSRILCSSRQGLREALEHTQAWLKTASRFPAEARHGRATSFSWTGCPPPCHLREG